jgi:quercetin dioxygenase-like cupin family protein
MTYQVHQLLDEIQPPESGKKSIVITDETNTKTVLFAFAAGAGLAEHVAPLPAIIQIFQGEAQLTVGDERVHGRQGTWIQMEPNTPHSITASTPVIMLLTLLKSINGQHKPTSET